MTLHHTLPWTDELRKAVAARLESFLATKREEALGLSPQSVMLVDQVTSLTMRGGKRLRPIVLTAAYRAVTGSQELAPVEDAGAALEMLQTYLLIHDDWMDLDDTRRGGPSVFAALRDAHGDAHLGASLAVLAGDLASAYASELITEAPFPTGRRGRGLAAFWRLQREAFFGQQLDLVATAVTGPDIERMYDLKTGSYTVRGPVVLGALLGDATDETIDGLARWAHPVGIAFQLRDELLGTFGDPETMGKPTGGDLRQGKVTTLVAVARERLTGGHRERLEGVLGNAEASGKELRSVTALLGECGAKDAVEERLRGLTAEARSALDNLPFAATDLHALTTMLIERES